MLCYRYCIINAFRTQFPLDLLIYRRRGLYRVTGLQWGEHLGTTGWLATAHSVSAFEKPHSNSPTRGGKIWEFLESSRVFKESSGPVSFLPARGLSFLHSLADNKNSQ